MKLAFGASVTESGLRFEHPGAVRSAVHGRWGLGEVVIVRIEDYQNIRSLKSNAYLWGHIYEEIAKHTGHKPEDIHEAMCELHLPNESKRVEFFNRMTGEALKVDTDHRRSSKLGGARFYDFVEDIRQWALDFLGVVTQDPDPEWWRKKTAA